MKGRLLLGMLLMAFGANAQDTHIISWSMNVGNAASISIDQGDIVRWEWSDAAPHTVTSEAGSADSFSSGTLTGVGSSFEHTFANVGDNAYKCEVHPGMMAGVITVDAVAGIEDNVKFGIEYFPNPTTDILTINSPDVINRIEIYDVNGRQVMNSKSDTAITKVHMENYPTGTYYVKVYTANASKDITVIRK